MHIKLNFLIFSVFTVTFDQCSASLLNKTSFFLSFFLCYNPQLMEVYHGFHNNIKQQKLFATEKKKSENFPK